MTEIQDKLDHLDELDRQRKELRNQLDKSLAIKQLWPNAFEGEGRVTSRVTGNPLGGSLLFTVTLADGKRHTLPLEEVPTVLWSEQVKKDMSKLSPFNKYNRKLRRN